LRWLNEQTPYRPTRPQALRTTKKKLNCKTFYKTFGLQDETCLAQF